MGIPGRRPLLEYPGDALVMREIREKVRFEDRPNLRGLADRLGFKSHRNLYYVAERYEQARGLGPKDKEAPAATTD